MQVVESNGEDANGDIDRRNELFNIVAAEFSIDLGKVGTNKQQVKSSFKVFSFLQLFEWTMHSLLTFNSRLNHV